MDNKKNSSQKRNLTMVVIVIVVIGLLALGYIYLLRVAMTNDITTSWLNSDMVEANSYLEKNSSYIGFVPEHNFLICENKISYPPIVNISSDGRDVVIFGLSCNKSKYYCVDSKNKVVTEKAIIPEEYVKSGATNCDYKK